MENERENYVENYMEAWSICRGSQEYELLSIFGLLRGHSPFW